jgi:hypothetical protein
MKGLIIIPALILLAGLGGGNPWLYQDPDFLQGSRFYASVFQPGSLTALEVVASPSFYLLGQGFDLSKLPIQLRPDSGAVETVSSSRKVGVSPPTISFDDFEEKSLNYARAKSSLRVAENGSWAPLNVPGLL